MHPRRQSSRLGFTLIELMVTIVLLGIITAIGAAAFTSSASVALNRANVLRLTQADLAARAVAVNNSTYADTQTTLAGIAFPAAIASDLASAYPSPPGTLTYTSSDSSDPNVISVGITASPTQVVLVDLSSNHTTCTVLIDSTAGPLGWGIVNPVTPGGCSAASVLGAIGSTTLSTDASSPTTIDEG